MHYVITGGAGNISKPITEALLAAGHTVTVVGRTAANLQELVDKGAKAAIGNVHDIPFLTQAFAGADAVYVMNPPDFVTNDVKGTYGQVGENYAAAIKANKVPYVVHLSSIGAHLPSGAGPVSGLYRAEQALNRGTDAIILHLRPSYFYNNLFANLDLIKQAGIIGSNFSITDKKFPVVDPSDIAAVATDALLKLNFTGRSVQYIVGDEVSTDAIAAAIGKAIGKPDLQWVHFPNDQAFAGMRQAGLGEDIARNYVEMGDALQSGLMTEDYWYHQQPLGKVKLEDFAKKFAAVYNS
jgi:uncharacterized protein YbjT (DUF2867 family)